MDPFEKLVWIACLENAVRYGGKVNVIAVMGKILAQNAEYRSKASQVKSLVEQVAPQVEKLSKEEQEVKIRELNPEYKPAEIKHGPEKKTLPDLLNVKGPVVMRLAPYPSGALHIGNARMIVLNDEYVKRYKGKLILCFDDTIGTSAAAMASDPGAKFIVPEAYDLIEEGLKWFGVNVHERYWKSDRVDIYQKYARELIERGEAYVCTCDADVFRTKHKQVGVDCPDRSVSAEENLARWEKMLDGTYAEGTAVVRLKTGMQLPNPALRDHVIMRISETPHPRIGTKCRVWPLMDFSWGIDDYLFGVTHILRGLDLQKEGEVERMIWKIMGWPDRETILYGRLNFSDEYKLSKTYQRQKIQEGEFSGWDDPRTWSLQSLAKRGIQPDALREALLDLGVSKREIDFDKSWVYAKNTKLINSQSDRIFFVQTPVKMHVAGIPFDQLVAKPLINPSLPEKGTREIPVLIQNGSLDVYVASMDLPSIKVGSHVRLKDLFTIEIQTIGDEVEAKFFKKELEEHAEVGKIQWVKMQDNVKVNILQPDGITTKGFAEKTLAGMKQGACAQFERYGYVRIIKKQKGSIQCYFIN